VLTSTSTSDINDVERALVTDMPPLMINGHIFERAAKQLLSANKPQIVTVIKWKGNATKKLLLFMEKKLYRLVGEKPILSKTTIC